MKFKYLYIISLLLFVTLQSCKDFLEEVPKNSTHVGEFWQSASDINSAVAGNYALLRDAITSGNNSQVPRHFVYGDGAQGNNFIIQYSGDGLEGIQTGDFTWRYTIESYGDWTKYIKAINMSNLVIEKVSQMDTDLLSTVNNPTRFKNEALGQAYFIRALTYFFMTRVWGDAPIILTAETDPIHADQIARSPKAEVIEQIIEDCHMAAKLLNWTYSDVNQAKVTANRGSVYALLAHVFLWRATTTDLTSDQPIMADVVSADTTIQRLKNFGGYSLVDTANYYSTFIGKSREGIFEIAASEANLEGSNRHIGTFFLRQQHIRYNNATWSRFYVPKSYLDQHYEKMPLGAEAEVWIEGQWVWNEPDWRWDWVEGHYNYQQLYSNEISDLRYYGNFTDVSLDQPTCIKYQNVNYRAENSAYLSNNIIIFRYSDILLLEAEIAIYRNQLEVAANIINNSRQRYDHLAKFKKLEINTESDTFQENKSKILKEYALERSRELFLEGHIFYDLIRTRQYADFITWLSPARFSQGGFYWPISPQLFKNNPKLTQTSYWIGRI